MERFKARGLVKLAAIAVLLVGALTVAAASAHSDRKTASFSGALTLTHTTITDWAKLASLSVKYSASTNVTLYVSTVRSGTTNLLYKVEVLAADSVAIFPDAVWMHKTDSLVLSNSIPVQATVEADYTSN